MNLLCEDGFAMLKEDGDRLLWADAAPASSVTACVGSVVG